MRTGNITALPNSLSGDLLAACLIHRRYVTAILPRMIHVACLYTKAAKKVQQAIT
jgi:hypothetical protein